MDSGRLPWTELAATAILVVVSWTIGALFVGWFYDVPLHASQLATIGGAAILLGFASPGVPRGAFIMLTPLLLAVGLPAEGVGLLIAVDAIPDMFCTVLNVTGSLAATTLVSDAATRAREFHSRWRIRDMEMA